MRIVAIALLLSGLGRPAIAETFSDWSFYAGTTPRGTAFCSILSAIKTSNVGQNIAIKTFKGTENLVVDLYKDTWNIPQGTDVEVMLDFGDNKPIVLRAYGDGHIVDIRLPTEDTAMFLSLVVDRPFMQVVFPGGNEGTWFVGGRGARQAVSKLTSCAL